MLIESGERNLEPQGLGGNSVNFCYSNNIALRIFSLDSAYAVVHVQCHVQYACACASRDSVFITTCRGPPFGFDTKLSEAYPDLYQKLKDSST